MPPGTPVRQAPGLVPHGFPGRGIVALASPAALPRASRLRRLATGVLLSPVLIPLGLALPVLGALGWTGDAERYTAQAVLLLDDGAGGGASRTSVLATSPRPLAAQAEIERLRSDAVIRDSVRRAGPGTLYPALTGPRFGVLPPLEPDAQVMEAADRFRQDLVLHRGAEPRVLHVAFTADTQWRAQAGLAALLDTALPPAARHGPTPVTDPAREIGQQIDAVRARHGVIDLALDARGVADRRNGLIRQRDGLTQQREAALATLASARALLAAQPGSVLAAKEVAQAANEEGRATLLRLQIERDHLAAQYAADFPGLKEADRKIATARLSLEDGKRNGLVTTREVRNPTVDLLTGRMLLAQVDADAVSGQLAAVERQLDEAKLRGSELLGVESQLRGLRSREDRLAAERPAVPANAAGIVLRVLQPGQVATEAAAEAWPRLALAVSAGLVLALAIWLSQRRLAVAVTAWIGQRLLRRSGLADGMLIEPEPLALPAGGWTASSLDAARKPSRIKDLNEASGRWI